MTLIDLFLSAPMPVRIVCGVLLFVFGVEFFLVPFRINLILSELHRIHDQLDELNQNVARNENITTRNERLLSVLLGATSETFKKRKD